MVNNNSPTTVIAQTQDFHGHLKQTIDQNNSQAAGRSGIRGNKKSESRENAQQALCKRRRLLPSCEKQSDSNTNKSTKEIFREKITVEVNDYFKILENGLFQHDLDPAAFRMQNEQRFPLLKTIAFHFLSIPETSASTERLFSCAGLSVKGNRNTIGPKLLEAEACAKLKFLKSLKC